MKIMCTGTQPERGECPLQVQEELLQHLDEFKWGKNGSGDWQTDQRSGEEKTEPEGKALISLFSNLSYGHKHWVMTQRTKWEIQVSFVGWQSDMLRNSLLQKVLFVEPLAPPCREEP